MQGNIDVFLAFLIVQPFIGVFFVSYWSIYFTFYDERQRGCWNGKGIIFFRIIKH
jgi:hypothetical protein